MLVPHTEVIVSKDGVELARRTVTPGEYVFGREGDVDFLMATPLASRHHARLHVNYDEWLIEDLGSSNGTFINDQRVAPHAATRVFPTQTLRVGDATVTLRRVRDTEAPEASLAPGAATLHAVLPEEIRKEQRFPTPVETIAPEAHEPGANGGLAPVSERRRLKTAACFTCAEPAGAQQFLDAVAAHALDRRAVPLHAREFLEKIAGGAFDRLSFIAGNLQSLLTRPAEVSRERRAASIFTAPAFWLVVSIFMVFLANAHVRTVEKVERQYPGFTEVPAAIAFYEAALEVVDHRTSRREDRDVWRQAPMGAITEAAALENASASAARFISYRAARLIRDPRFDEITRDALDASERALARRAVAEFPEVTPEEFTAAALIVHPGISETRSFFRNAPLFIGPIFILSGLLAIALIHCASMLLFATGPGLRMFGLAVVDRTGRPAGRLHLLGRGAIAWLPLPLTAIACFAILRLESTDTTRTLLAASLILGSLILLGGALWSALRPAAGPHDLATGTRVVPR